MGRLMVSDRQRGRLLPAPDQMVGSRGRYRQQALASQASSSEASSSLVSTGGCAQCPGDMLAAIDEARLDAEEVRATQPLRSLISLKTHNCSHYMPGSAMKATKLNSVKMPMLVQAPHMRGRRSTSGMGTTNTRGFGPDCQDLLKG